MKGDWLHLICFSFIGAWVLSTFEEMCLNFSNSDVQTFYRFFQMYRFFKCTHLQIFSIVLIFDSPCMHSLHAPTNTNKTFDEYAYVFVPYVEVKVMNKINLLRDRYFDDSLKNRIRSNHGMSVPEKVTS